MDYDRRSYAGIADQALMRVLVEAAPHKHLHVIDVPYRFSSWALDEPEQASLWFALSGELHAWACLQTPFWALDYALHPDAPPSLLAEVLQWADGRMQATHGTTYGRPIWFANVFAEQMEEIAALEVAGFVCQADVGEDSWSKVLMLHDRSGATSAVTPPGFTLRPLAGEAEVPAYVRLHRAVFESESMTATWRAATLRQPAYREELDLVVEAPDGQLAAFCVGWLAQHGPRGRASGQIEPLGVAAAYRQLGLGRAIASACVQRLYEMGAEEVYVETDAFRNAALALYEAVGFRVQRDVLVYRKDIHRTTADAAP
jgi:ribosomal protein S18 acetylase RimI-like enzyme